MSDFLSRKTKYRLTGSRNLYNAVILLLTLIATLIIIIILFSNVYMFDKIYLIGRYPDEAMQFEYISLTTFFKPLVFFCINNDFYHSQFEF